MKYLQNKLYNVLFILVSTILCLYLYHASGVLDGIGMAAMLLNWLPLFIGLITLGFYLLTRLITEKYGWILTVLGVFINVFLVVSAYWA